MKKSFSLHNIAIIYLWIPIILFLASWCRPLLSVPLLVLLAWALFRDCQTHVSEDHPDRFAGKWIWYASAAVLFLFWCLLSGHMGAAAQADDWQKHNVLLNDLVQYPWPVRYEYRGMEGIISYYLASYLVPALAGKLGGFFCAELAALAQTLAGLFLAFCVLARHFRVSRAGGYLAICLTMILFSTFMFPFASIYHLICPADAGSSQWMSGSTQIQYSSNIVLLRWVFPQCVPAWLATALLFTESDHIESWGLICVPIALYSSFALIGLAVLALAAWFARLLSPRRGTCLSQTLDGRNLVSFAVLLVLTGYICGNLLQPKPDDPYMRFGLNSFAHRKALLVLFHLTWLVWAAVLWKKERRQVFFGAACGTLLLLPFFHLGKWNDLCMRASIPALYILCILVLKHILDDHGRTPFRLLLAALICVSSRWSVLELKEAAASPGSPGNRNIVYEDMTDMFDTESHTAYQYVDWNCGTGINRWIIRN